MQLYTITNDLLTHWHAEMMNYLLRMIHKDLQNGLPYGLLLRRHCHHHHYHHRHLQYDGDDVYYYCYLLRIPAATCYCCQSLISLFGILAPRARFRR